MSIIYYVGAEVDKQSSFLLWRCGWTAHEEHKLHTTIIYSRKWFPYKQAQFFPLILEPPYLIDNFQGLCVLRYNNSRIFERHIKFRNDGASWDFDDFKGHISLGQIRPSGHNPAKVPDFPIALSHEYYQTWLEDK